MGRAATRKTAIEGIGAPPEDIRADAAAAAEWERIINVAKEAGSPLEARDRTAIELYCRTWSINRKSWEHVQAFGAIVIFPNTFPGPNPHYKAWKETASLMRGVLNDLGLTPASRDFKSATAADDAGEPGELEI